MKVLLLFLAVLLATTYADDDQETLSKKYTQKSKEKQQECKNQHPNISDADFEKLVNNRKKPETPDEKCFASCYAKGMGYMTKKGKMNLDKLKAANKKKFKLPQNLQKADEVVDICVDKVKSLADHCETGAQFFVCYASEAAKKNLKLPKYFKEKKQ